MSISEHENGLLPIDCDWYGAILQHSPKWSLKIIDNALVLRGAHHSKPICIAKDSDGEFIEGLSEADVVELFLLNPNTGFYIEFNLSPHGAWWCCTFESPRVRSVEMPNILHGVKTNANISQKGWDSSLLVPLKSLPSHLAFDTKTTRGNITFCLGQPQQYFSMADLGGETPDFHRPDRWITLAKLIGEEK
ncbi:MAG: hypothetical protein FWG02_01925 [Holophagaceae bacterium]|nr:hypothetical protein [Holophagaceae bacterium]